LHRLTEAEVMRLAIRAEPRLRAAEAEVGVAKAEVIGATQLDNPSLEWEREAFIGSGPDTGSEDAVSLAIPLDLSGRRSARGALARSSVELARADVSLTRSAVVSRALRLYYGALAARQDAAIARQAVERLDEAARVLASRHQVGAVSGYDRLRLEIEVELARSRALEAASEEQRRAAVLGAVLGLERGQLELVGELTPNPAVVPGAAAGSTAARPSGRRMAAAISALNDAMEAAGRSWIPRLELRGGVRIGSADETRYGYIAGVALELPLLSHGQDLSSAASAKKSAVRERMAAEQRKASVETTDSSLWLVSSRQELARFDLAMAQRLERLQSGALASYREGARGLTELLDAQRTRTTVERRLLELRLTVKQAEVALRAARGELQ